MLGHQREVLRERLWPSPSSSQGREKSPCRLFAAGRRISRTFLKRGPVGRGEADRHLRQLAPVHDRKFLGRSWVLPNAPTRMRSFGRKLNLYALRCAWDPADRTALEVCLIQMRRAASSTKGQERGRRLDISGRPAPELIALRDQVLDFVVAPICTFVVHAGLAAVLPGRDDEQRSMEEQPTGNHRHRSCDRPQPGCGRAELRRATQVRR